MIIENFHKSFAYINVNDMFYQLVPHLEPPNFCSRGCVVLANTAKTGEPLATAQKAQLPVFIVSASNTKRNSHNTSN